MRNPALVLRPDGPHSDDYTAALARGFAETVRVLNHATRPVAAGVTYPQTTYDVLGGLVAGVWGLPQLFDQMAAYLDSAAAHGRLAHDTGADPDQCAAEASRLLQVAVRHAAALGTALASAHGITAHLYDADPAEDGAAGAECGQEVAR
jgi:hypothetical protein